MENKTDKELMDWYLRHPEEKAGERRVFLGLYGHKRRAQAARLIDQLAAGEERKHRRVWPLWTGSLAAAACLLGVLLMRGKPEDAPVLASGLEPTQVAQVQPIVETRPASSHRRIVHPSPVDEETGQAPYLPREEAAPAPSAPQPEAECWPAMEPTSEGLPYAYCCAELPDSLVTLGEGALIFTS